MGDVTYKQVREVWNDMVFKGYLDNDEEQIVAQPGPTGIPVSLSSMSSSPFIPLAPPGRGGLTCQHMQTHENNNASVKEHREVNSTQEHHYQYRVSFS